MSGGEPLQSFFFSLALLSKLKDAKIHTAIETCGYAPWGNLLEIAKVTDLFLYDLKHMNSDTHKYYTGVGNELIVNNLLKLASFHKNIVVRSSFDSWGKRSRGKFETNSKNSCRRRNT